MAKKDYKEEEIYVLELLNNKHLINNTLINIIRYCSDELKLKAWHKIVDKGIGALELKYIVNKIYGGGFLQNDIDRLKEGKFGAEELLFVIEYCEDIYKEIAFKMLLQIEESVSHMIWELPKDRGFYFEYIINRGNYEYRKKAWDSLLKEKSHADIYYARIVCFCDNEYRDIAWNYLIDSRLPQKIKYLLDYISTNGNEKYKKLAKEMLCNLNN